MRVLGAYIAVGVIVLLGLAGVVVWTPRQVSVLIEARSEFVEFGQDADQKPLEIRFVGAVVCDDALVADAAPEAVSQPCPGYRTLGRDWSGVLLVHAPARLHVERRGQGPMRVVVRPEPGSSAPDDGGEPSVAEFVLDAPPVASGSDPPAPTEAIALQGLVTVIVDAEAGHWFAADAARRLGLGALVVEGGEVGAPALLDGEVLMRGRSVYRVWTDPRPDVAETRFLLDLGGERLRLGEVARLCAGTDCGNDAPVRPETVPEAVLRARPHPDGGLAVTVRALATGVEVRSVGAQPRLIAPSVFDRLYDPVFAWTSVLLTVFTSVSLLAHLRRETILGMIRNARRVIFEQVSKRVKRRSESVKRPAKRPAKRIRNRGRKHG